MWKFIITVSFIMAICRGQAGINMNMNNLYNYAVSMINNFDVETENQKQPKNEEVKNDDVFNNPLSVIPVLIGQALSMDSLVSLEANENSDSVIQEFNAGHNNPDIYLTIDELLAKNGFVTERHQVTTEDGYLLTLFRIPSKGPVVFLMHGLLGSADDFVVAGPKTGLAYFLANEGFDVWLGNARGNKFSRKHTHINPSNASFWDFSWHEIGVYDLPAMIDYILFRTKQKSLKYIGHSQGTTTFFVMASEKPEYNRKVDIMIALSPVAFMGNTKSPLVRFLARSTNIIHAVAKHAGMYEFFPDNYATKAMKSLICGSEPISDVLCSNPLVLFVGFTLLHVNVTNLPVVYSHMPSGASAKQFAHFGQGVVSGAFRKFDYGLDLNKEKYGTRKPPNYKLRNVVTPVVLFYSKDDWLAQPKDVRKLHSKLNNVLYVHQIPAKSFNHLDFLLAKELNELIYTKLRIILGSKKNVSKT